MPGVVPERTEVVLPKPQYRTLVKALDELAFSALDVLDANEEAGDLARRNRRLRQAAHSALELIERGRAAMAEKSRKRKEAGNFPQTDYD